MVHFHTFYCFFVKVNSLFSIGFLWWLQIKILACTILNLCLLLYTLLTWLISSTHLLIASLTLFIVVFQNRRRRLFSFIYQSIQYNWLILNWWLWSLWIDFIIVSLHLVIWPWKILNKLFKMSLLFFILDLSHDWISFISNLCHKDLIGLINTHDLFGYRSSNRL